MDPKSKTASDCTKKQQVNKSVQMLSEIIMGIVKTASLQNQNETPLTVGLGLHLHKIIRSLQLLHSFKNCVHYFLSKFYCSLIDTPSKTMKNVFISSKKFFSFSRYSHFCISVFPSFSPDSHCFRGWLKIKLKVYNVINCPNKNLKTHFVWYLENEKRYDTETFSIDRVLNKEHYYGRVMQKMCTNS